MRSAARGMTGLLAMVVLVGMGEKMAERFLPIYILALGGTAIAIGALSGMDNLLSALYSLPGGWLSEKLGTKRALLLFNAIAMAGFCFVIAVPRWEAVLAGSVLFLSWTAISLPASMALISKLLPGNRRTFGVSLHSLVRRIPMALGPVIGGLCIDRWGEVRGVRIAFLAALCMAAMAAVMQQLLIKDDRPSSRPSGGRSGLICPRLRNLLVSDILIRFCEQIPYAFVVVWCMKTVAGMAGGQPVGAAQFGYLTTIEMVTAMVVYVPVARMADRLGKKPFVLVTFVFFTLFPVVLLFCRSFWPLAAAFLLRGLKEFGEPARKALIMDLAPEGRKAAAFGFYYLIRDSVVAVAAFAGALLWNLSPQINFLAASFFGLAGTIWFALRGKDFPPAAEA
jgi:MFS family permease